MINFGRPNVGNEAQRYSCIQRPDEGRLMRSQHVTFRLIGWQGYILCPGDDLRTYTLSSRFWLR